MQIGPKIRIGGTLGAIGGGVQKAAGKLAPIAGLVNPALGLGMSALSGHASPTGVLSSLAGGGLSKIPGASQLGGALGKIPGVSQLGGLLGKIPGLDKLGGLVSGGGSDGKGSLGLLGDLGGMLADHPDAALAGASTAMGAYDKYRAGQIQDRAMNYATDGYDQRAPARELGMKMIQDQSRPDIHGIFDDPGNPYAKKRTIGGTLNGGY